MEELLEQLSAPERHRDVLPDELWPTVPLRFRETFTASALHGRGVEELVVSWFEKFLLSQVPVTLCNFAGSAP